MKNVLGRFSLILAFLAIYVPGSSSYAYVYGEHKELGEVAFRVSIDHLVKQGVFPNKQVVEAYIKELLNMEYNEAEKSWEFRELSHQPNVVTYGVLGGLAGDHVQNTMDMEAYLQDRSSKLNQTISLHNHYLGQSRTSAPDKELFDVDHGYGILAYVNYSHFYQYAKSFEEHLEDVDPENVRELFEPSNTYKIYEATNTHLINRYLTLHLFAVTMAERAGRFYAKGKKEEASTALYYAFLTNAFADHYLEDAFAAGHLVVNRTFFSTLINSKALHDFYNDVGATVANRKGEVWKITGDGAMNRSEKEWEDAKKYSDVRLGNLNAPYAKGYTDEATRYTDKYVRAVAATTVSIIDVWEAFERARKGDETVLLDRVPKERKKRPAFYFENFEVLSMIPIPFGTELKDYSFPKGNKKEVEKAVQLLPTRNYVRSRVANSLMFIYGPALLDAQPGRLGGRFNLGGLYYDFHDAEHKKGTTDHWLAGTVSFSHGFSHKADPSFWWFKGGPAYNLDVWVSDKRFFSVYSYLEMGGDVSQDDLHFLFAPTVGLQLGSLIGWDNYTLPRWVSIPLQMLLPVKASMSYNVIAGARKNRFTWQIEIDLLY